MSKFKTKLEKIGLLTKLVTVFVLGVAVVTLATLTIVQGDINRKYISSYSGSVAHILEYSSGEMSITGEAIINIVRTLRSDWSLRAFINDTDKTSEQSSYITYSMVNNIRKLLSNNNLARKMSLAVVGTNGVTYVTGSGLGVPVEELLESDFTIKAAADPIGIHYQFLPVGFTSQTAAQSAFVASAAIASVEGNAPIAYIYITISQDQLRAYYRDFTSESNGIVMLDSTGSVVSSTSDSYIGHDMGSIISAAMASADKPYFTVDIDGRRSTYVSRPIDYWGLWMVGDINTVRSDELENASRFVFITSVAVAVATIFITAVILGRITMPLKSLTKHMSRIKSGNFADPLPVSGEYEIRELISAYNYMMDDMTRHIHQLKEAESQKRDAEIRALRNQIKPHFINNTLSSVKLLIWRGENDKASAALDSFTLLIKNMISDKSDMITLRDEIENLKNYSILQQIRFGDQIKTVFNVSGECMDAMIPKMILQPIIENAFFHAYPEKQSGTINVFANKSGNVLVAEVIDDGVGFREKLERAELRDVIGKCSQQDTKNEGIGLANVDERLRLLFGEEHRVTITSDSGGGTIVRVTMPLILR